MCLDDCLAKGEQSGWSAAIGIAARSFLRRTRKRGESWYLTTEYQARTEHSFIYDTKFSANQVFERWSFVASFEDQSPSS